MEVSMTLEQFTDMLNKDKRMQSVDSGNIKLTFNSLMEKAESKEKERLKEEQRKLKKLEQNFKNLLKNHEVNETTKFESIKEKICTEEAYTNLNGDQECERVFNEFIAQMQETCLHHIKKKREKKEE